MNTQWSNLFCPCERSEIGEVPQGEGVEKDRKDTVSLSVPATSRERRNSTNNRNAYGTNGLRNIGRYGDNIRNMISTPQSRMARQLPYIAPQHRGAKRLLYG